jgi:hypothetical protein
MIRPASVTNPFLLKVDVMDFALRFLFCYTVAEGALQRYRNVIEVYLVDVPTAGHV